MNGGNGARPAGNAAKLAGASQPQISDLMRGKIHRFSIDNLVVLLAGAGLCGDLKVRRVN